MISIQPVTQLTPDQLNAVQALVSVCNAADNLDLKINPEMLAQRPGNVTDDFLAVVDETIVGYLGLYGFGRDEIEVSGMVHPEFRRQGIFSALFARARVKSAERGIERMLLICPASSAAGHAWVEQTEARYTFSEHLMVLRQIPPARELPEGLAIRQISAADVPVVAQLLADGFEMPRERAEQSLTLELSNPKRGHRLISDHEEPVGVIGVDTQDEGAYIYGFVVSPARRGQGIGRAALQHTVRELAREGIRPIQLEVEATNERALELYTSSGFVITSAYDYYALPLS